MSDSLIQRRHFLKTTAGAAAFLLAAPLIGKGSDNIIRPVLKVGLVGCGGRGLGAVKNALDADPDVVVWALGDVFQERIDASAKLLTEQYGGRMQANKSRCFVGLDSYRKVINSDIDVILLCTPPAFRPEHLLASIVADKHIYAEKPVAVDVPGVLAVMEAARLAAAKNIVILDGFCWRYDDANKAAHEKLAHGELGEIRSFDGYYYSLPPKSPLAADSRNPGESDVAWALRNWTAWNWLSGGELVEQAVHTIDGMMWSMGDKPPVAAFGSGGRAQRTDDGDVWDHYDVVFEYEHGATAHISCRQWVGSHSEICNRTFCEKGILIGPQKPRIESRERWRYRGPKTNKYANTHIAFYDYVRKRQQVQTLEQAAVKTLVAIMGREAAQTGQRITWDQIQRSTTRLVPDHLTMESSMPAAHIPKPGRS